MKKIYFLFIFLILISGSLMAQSKYGDATMDELNMHVYDQDTTANAVILLKEGETRFVYHERYGFQYEYTIRTKIKILTKDGLNWCDHSIYYYEKDTDNKEIITNLSGTTYNLENDKIVKTKLSKDFIFDEDLDGRAKLKKITLPAAKVGSVIEFKYTIVSDFYYELRDFTFQTSIPVLQTVYEVTIPEYFHYNLNMQGYEDISASKKSVNEHFNIRYKDSGGRFKSTTHTCSAEKITFRGQGIQAMKDEGYVWALSDYISKATFELARTQFPGSLIKNYTSNWDNVDKEIFDYNKFGGNLKKTGLFKNEIVQKEGTLENAKEILDLVKSKVSWNEKDAFYPDNLSDALRTGSGNSADMNFLLINALKAAKFDVYPVVLSKRNSGRLPISHPSFSALNYTIVGLKIDTLYYFTDASSQYADWNVLPPRCMVPEARLLELKNSSWFDLSTISSGSTIIVAQYQFDQNEYKGQVRISKRKQDAFDFKKSYSSYKDETEYVEKLSSRLSNEISNFEISDMEKADLKINFNVVNHNVTLGDEYLYINPLFEMQYQENPFKAEKRSVPVQFSNLRNYRQTISIDIPSGYIVEELPKSERFVLDEEALVLDYRVAQGDGKIMLNYNFQLKDLLFLPSNYPFLREFFAKIIAKNSEQIVLKKID